MYTLPWSGITATQKTVHTFTPSFLTSGVKVNDTYVLDWLYHAYDVLLYMVVDTHGLVYFCSSARVEHMIVSHFCRLEGNNIKSQDDAWQGFKVHKPVLRQW
jgi:hypothetical protein